MASDAVAAAPATRAVELLDAALARRPEKDDAALAAAADAICACRQDMIARRDAAGLDAAAAQDLATLNGVLSLVLAIHFPLGNVRWHELERARATLAQLVGRAQPG